MDIIKKIEKALDIRFEQDSSYMVKNGIKTNNNLLELYYRLNV